MRFIQGSVSAAVKDGETGDESQVLSSETTGGLRGGSHLFSSFAIGLN